VLPSGNTQRSSRFRYSSTCIQFMSEIFMALLSRLVRFNV
jgi:hypothetical protein